MQQDGLFYEDFRGAIRHLVGALGGPKAVGGLLRPALSVKQAENWVHDCLNVDRQTKFDLEDLTLLLGEARRRGIHCAMHQLADETGYARPDVAPVKSPYEQLADEFQRQAAELARLAENLGALERATDKRIK